MQVAGTVSFHHVIIIGIQLQIYNTQNHKHYDIMSYPLQCSCLELLVFQ